MAKATPGRKKRQHGEAKVESVERHEKSHGLPLVVGLGASAGGLEAFRSFFAHMPPDSGMIFILVQHLDPNRPSSLVDLLSAATEMTVVEAQDGARLAPNSVFVIPPDATLTLSDDRLRVERPAPPRETRRPIDVFFTSLAESQGDNAVCIILSGGGSDGSIGLNAIKDRGGLCLAQAESDSKAKLGMPSSAAATGLVDEVLVVEHMPQRLLDYQRHLQTLRGRSGPDGELLGGNETLAKICRILRSGVGHDFSQYKDRTLSRRIQRRMQVLHADTPTEYVERLRKDPEEVRRLFQELLIGVTGFFRDPEAFAALDAQALPSIISRKGGGDNIRVWVAGCSSGEEAYSIAILLKERLAGLADPPRLQIFASDIDETAVAFARAGKYRLSQLEGVSDARRERWFSQENDHWCPVKEIREACVFSLHSTLKDPPFSKLDLVTCRNLLIYLQPPAQDRLINAFEYALQPAGFLFLGASESIARHGKGFAVLDKKHRIYQRSEMSSPPSADMGNFAPGKRSSLTSQPRAGGAEDRLDLGVRRVMERHYPAYVVVNARNEAVRFAGPVAKFLGPSPGAASLDLFALLQRSLRSAARAVLQKAAATRQPAMHANLIVEIDGASRRIDLVAELAKGAGDAGFCVLAFLDRGPALHPATDPASDPHGTNDLEQELVLTRARLQATIDELETNNEEMKSANEEYQSVNEELQSTNEELETSKEEMQSINEELQTVNAELNAKNDTLTRLNSDLKNFLDATEIATIFLDANLRITSFTPAMTDLFHLREADYHRPITEIASRFEHGDLASDVMRVQRTLTAIEREVTSAAGRSYTMRIRPYRRVDNVIDGAVITFADITDRKRLEEEQVRRSELVESSNDAIIGLDGQGVITSWNKSAADLYGYTAAEVVGRNVSMLVTKKGRDQQQSALRRTGQGEQIQHEEAATLNKDGSSSSVSVSISATRDAEGIITGASLIVRDISERMRARERQAVLIQELNHRVKNTLASVQSIAAQTLDHNPDPQAFLTAFQMRLAALSRSHNLLAQTEWQGSELHKVLLEEVRAHIGATSERLEIDGPDVLLGPKATLAFAMAFHELATNSAKYGALSTPNGRLTVKWRVTVDETSQLHFEWRESGGPLVEPPTRRGMGSRLIERGLTYELGGEAKLHYDPNGVRYELRTPMKGLEAPK